MLFEEINVAGACGLICTLLWFFNQISADWMIYVLQRQNAVAVYLKSKQLLYFGFAPMQSQKAVTAYLRSKQLLPLGFAILELFQLRVKRL